MDVRGTLKGIQRDFKSNRIILSLELTEGEVGQIETLQNKDLSITLKQFRERRSKDANALLWACLGKIAECLGGDKEFYYMQALRKYGQGTLIEIKKDAIERMREVYREIDVIGQRGEWLSVMCYYGSHLYTTSEFAVLLDGVIEDMRNAGIETPVQEEMDRALEAWERRKA